jgi:predicted nuclease of predicted toxin-antitoxin system
MRFLLDQDVYAATARLLASQGHDVVLARALGLPRVTDSALLRAAQDQRRIMLTRDRDFGRLVFVQGLQTGVIYVRISPLTVNSVHAELSRVLQLYTEQKLFGSFVVVEAGQHRIRALEL